jgi:hypothetical protein
LPAPDFARWPPRRRCSRNCRDSSLVIGVSSPTAPDQIDEEIALPQSTSKTRRSIKKYTVHRVLSTTHVAKKMHLLRKTFVLGKTP